MSLRKCIFCKAWCSIYNHSVNSLTVVFRSSTSLHCVCLHVWSVTKTAVLKSLLVVNLSVSLSSYSSFYFLYFEPMLLMHANMELMYLPGKLKVLSLSIVSLCLSVMVIALKLTLTNTNRATPIQ